ncbi:hypothetical protein [Actinocatenispora comari]|uniref:GGDEF domain-containing protein n=1 Tax=Actinocatenispora comari TaxID=2807577 RepID=A0A8J4EI85_9ACTN|nr:hypothetical protein [Actinocatenispora comari]GIL24966.1 hypothetical protein NUM_02210 [Actinocatenispora comari]
MAGSHRRLTSVPGVPGSWSFGRNLEQIRQTWRRESVASGWSRPHDWWVPEVDVLAAALSRASTTFAPGPGRAPLVDTAGRLGAAVPACAGLGQARAEAGVGLAEALDDLAALYRTLPVGTPPLPAVRAFVEAWADVWLRVVADAGCVDPLTELASRGYLRARLTELYRAAEQTGERVPDRYRLVVVTLGAASRPEGRPGWRLLLRRVAVAEALREAFPGGETLAAVAPDRAVAIVDQRLPDPVHRLRGVLAGRPGIAPVRVTTAELPERVVGLAELLTELGE